MFSETLLIYDHISFLLTTVTLYPYNYAYHDLHMVQSSKQRMYYMDRDIFKTMKQYICNELDLQFHLKYSFKLNVSGTENIKS